jgi:predicted permease
MVGIPLSLAAFGEAGVVPIALIIAVHLPVMMAASAALIDRAPGAPDGCYVASGNRLVQVPAEFFGLER